MAIERDFQKRSLTVRTVAGYNGDGSNKYANYTYSGITEEATDEQIYAVGNALAGLMAQDLYELRTTEVVAMVEA